MSNMASLTLLLLDVWIILSRLVSLFITKADLFTLSFTQRAL